MESSGLVVYKHTPWWDLNKLVLIYRLLNPSYPPHAPGSKRRYTYLESHSRKNNHQMTHS
jgi:hypothetical protein